MYFNFYRARKLLNYVFHNSPLLLSSNPAFSINKATHSLIKNLQYNRIKFIAKLELKLEGRNTFYDLEKELRSLGFVSVVSLNAKRRLRRRLDPTSYVFVEYVSPKYYNIILEVILTNKEGIDLDSLTQIYLSVVNLFKVGNLLRLYRL